jgi:hypothetical protein
MKHEGCSIGFVWLVLAWKTVGSMVPIFWDGCVRVVTAIIPLGKLIAKFKGLG